MSATRMQALVFDRFGGPEVLSFRELPMPTIARGTILVKLAAIGLNFADIYRRRGDYRIDGSAPFISGYEGAGEVVAIGAGIDGWAVGDRVGFADVPFAHATHVVVPVEKAIRLPSAITLDAAASILLQGLTAQYLVEDSVAIQPGQTILVHAAAGGVGRLITQMAISHDCKVYGTASTSDKRRQVLENGATALAYSDDWIAALRASGGADIVYDSLASTLVESLSALKQGGRVILFGMANGRAPQFDPVLLLENSTGIIGGDLWTYLSSAEERQRRADKFFALLSSGKIRLPPIRTFPLADGANAHRLLEDRSFSGKVLLMP